MTQLNTLVLDSKLTWTKHLEHRISKCLKIFWCCRSAIGKSWGLTPRNILWIYNAIVKPMLAYGAFIWWKGTVTAIASKKLGHIQRVACLAITGAMPTTPQAALEAMLYLPKLEAYIMKVARNTAEAQLHRQTAEICKTHEHTSGCIRTEQHLGC